MIPKRSRRRNASCKTWEIGFYALNNTSTNTYMMMMMYVSYLVGGIMGVGFALVSVLLTVMRVWTVYGSIIGFMVDKTNGRLGKNRPFIIIGNLILMVCSFIMFFWAAAGEFCAPPAVFHCSVCNLYHRLHLPVCCHQIGAVLHDERSKAAADICHL